MTNPKARELLKDPETAMLMKLIQQQQAQIGALQTQNTSANQNITALNNLVQSLIARIVVLENTH